MAATSKGDIKSIVDQGERESTKFVGLQDITRAVQVSTDCCQAGDLFMLKLEFRPQMGHNSSLAETNRSHFSESSRSDVNYAHYRLD